MVFPQSKLAIFLVLHISITSCFVVVFTLTGSYKKSRTVGKPNKQCGTLILTWYTLYQKLPLFNWKSIFRTIEICQRLQRQYKLSWISIVQKCHFKNELGFVDNGLRRNTYYDMFLMFLFIIFNNMRIQKWWSS